VVDTVAGAVHPGVTDGRVAGRDPLRVPHVVLFTHAVIGVGDGEDRGAVGGEAGEGRAVDAAGQVRGEPVGARRASGDSRDHRLAHEDSALGEGPLAGRMRQGFDARAGSVVQDERVAGRDASHPAEVAGLGGVDAPECERGQQDHRIGLGTGVGGQRRGRGRPQHTVVDRQPVHGDRGGPGAGDAYRRPDPHDAQVAAREPGYGRPVVALGGLPRRGQLRAGGQAAADHQDVTPAISAGADLAGLIAGRPDARRAVFVRGACLAGLPAGQALAVGVRGEPSGSESHGAHLGPFVRPSLVVVPFTGERPGRRPKAESVPDARVQTYALFGGGPTASTRCRPRCWRWRCRGWRR